jgi:hypothetical protein
MNLAEFTEDDVVEAFKVSLRAFIRNEGGAFGVRRVTLRDEKMFPSDQDFTLLFRSQTKFRLHVFGLQFKRWNRNGWILSQDQESKLVGTSSVVGYCLPCPSNLSVENALHAYYFVNPARLPMGCTRLDLLNPGEISWLGMSPTDLANSVQSQLDLSLRLESFLQDRTVVVDPTSEVVKLRRTINSTGSIVKKIVEELNWRATARPSQKWGTSIIRMEDSERKYSHIIPHLSWGEFFEALKRGATVVNVPGGPNNLPEPNQSPPHDRVSPGTGVGLTIMCSGAWGSEWAERQVVDHLDQWTRSVLEPPAAVIAYESFTRSLELIEFLR